MTSCDREKYSKVLDIGFDSIIPAYMWKAETIVKKRLIKYAQNILRNKLDDRWIPLDKYDYAKISPLLCSDLDREEYVFPSAIPQWDRSPRSGRKAVIYYNATPALFKKHLQDIYEKIKLKPFDRRIVFLRSWNEWGEGNYVEPDQKYGTGFLDAIHDVFVD